MFRNYVVIAFRSLLKNRLFSAINIFGLSLSLSISMIAIMYVKDQCSYDTFHTKQDRIYRITTKYERPTSARHFASTPLPLYDVLKEEFQGMEKVVRVYPAFSGNAELSLGEIPINGAFVDDGFFDVFSFSLEKGNVGKAFAKPNSVVISKETALRVFGEENPLGQVIHMTNFGEFTVTGVLQEPQGKSHISFDALASFSSVTILESNKALPQKSNNWHSIMDAYTYVLLKGESTQEQLEHVLHSSSERINDLSDEDKIYLSSQSINEITPYWEGIYNNLGRGNTWGAILGIVGMALAILFTACFNYTNLSIARSLTRAKEVGIRKVSGALKHQIFGQFIMESIMVALVSFTIAHQLLILMIKGAPFAKEFIPDIVIDSELTLYFLLFTIFTGLIAGTAPAWILSSFEPIKVLKSLITLKVSKGISFKKILITSQFILAIVSTVFLFVMHDQFLFMATADYGFKKENIYSIPLQGMDNKLLKNELVQLNGVEKVSLTSDNMGKFASGVLSFKMQREDQGIPASYYMVDENFIATHELALVDGDGFIDGISDENMRHIVLNEKAVESLLQDDLQVVGKTVMLNDTIESVIAGVVKDFNYETLSFDIKPLILIYSGQYFKHLNLSIHPEADKERLEGQIEGVWKGLYTNMIFDGNWLDEKIYDEHRQKGSVFFLGFLTIMIFSIACLGLLGMVVYTSEVRKSEVAIRKTLGASVFNLIHLLSGDFMKLLIIAGFIALPIGYLLGMMFLQNFAYQVDIGFKVLGSSFLILFGIGGITIGTQTYKSAKDNPTEYLRRE